METVNKTIAQVFAGVVQKNPNNDALIHVEAGARYNYALLAWEVERAAKGFLKLGITHGQAVAIWAPNIPEWIISLLALAKIGAVAVPVDPGASVEDLSFVLADSRCTAVVTARGPEDEEMVQGVLEAKESAPDLTSIIVVADKTDPEAMVWSEFTALGTEIDQTSLESAAALMRPEEPAAIMYTSGTTGRPKGVVLDHLGLVNKSVYSAQRQRFGKEDRFCLFFPLYHMFGNTCIALTGLLSGSALIMPSRVFRPEAALESMKRQQCTAVFGSPSMFSALLDNPLSGQKVWKTVKKGTIGGAPCPVELMKRIVIEMGVSGLVAAWGITEASSWITMTDPDDPIEMRVGTIGKALPCSEVKIADPRSGEDLPINTQGELCTRGFLMKGYHGMPAATAAAIDREGWFHTGDLGEIDDQGYVRITGRLKDVIKRNDVEIFPVEVEEILYGHSKVSEVQVFGFPDPESGQEVAAWIKAREGSGLTMEEIREFARKHVPAEKAPHFFKIVSGYPTTRSGKVQKFKLSELAAIEYGRKDNGAQPLYTCS